MNTVVATESRLTPLRRIAQLGRRIDPAAYVVYLIFLGILLFFAITLSGEGFTSEQNLLNILQQAAPVAVMAVGFTFTMSAGELDLSIGSVVALVALVAAAIMKEAGVALGIAAGLGVGLAVGTLNGFFVTVLRLPSFLVTLASMGLVAGVAQTVTDLNSVAVTDLGFAEVFGSGDLLGVSTLIWWMVGVTLVGHFVYRHTRFGAHVLATGDNVDAARAAAIRTRRIKFAVLLISALAAALAALLYIGRLQGARYTLGSTDLLTVIAAVVLGGTSLFGGKGSVVGAAIGGIILSMLNNGLILSGLSVSEQNIARGGLLLLAISATLREKRA
ncbi:MAG: ABC transporter permease [Solirubrobacterales bacterium]